MIEFDYDTDTWFVSCDFCSEEIEVEASSFMGVIRHIKNYGWQPIKEVDEKHNCINWKHKCLSCTLQYDDTGTAGVTVHVIQGDRVI